MKYHDLVMKLSNTFVSDLPGVKTVHSLISSGIEWKHQLTAGEKWIEYNGADLYADTSDHVAGRIEKRGDYDTQTRKQIENQLNVGDFAIDIGAHIGHQMVNMRQSVGSNGTVWAFEPNPNNVGYINKTLSNNKWDNVDLFPIALSNTEGSDQIIISDPKNTGKAALQDTNQRDMHPHEQYSIETRRLTSILNERGIEEIDLIKIDVEGGEVDIIRDLAQDFQSIDTILLEFHSNKIDKTDVVETYEILDNHGEITDFDGDIVTLESVLDKKQHIIWHQN